MKYNLRVRSQVSYVTPRVPSMWSITFGVNFHGGIDGTRGNSIASMRKLKDEVDALILSSSLIFYRRGKGYIYLRELALYDRVKV